MTMGMLFLIVIVGFLCGKTHVMTQPLSKGLSGLIVNLTCPMLIMASTMGDKMPDRSLILPLLLIGSVTYALLLAVATHLPKLFGVKADERGIYSFMLAFGNVGFIGYPVVASIFGPEAVFYASVLNVPNTITVYIWGAQFIAGKDAGNHLWHRLYSPGLIGTYISILIVAFGWHTPQVLSQPCALIGNITVPGSLLIIGYSISQIPARHMVGGPRIFIMALFRLLLLPLSLWGVFCAINMLPGLSLDPVSIAINTLITAMPVASFGTIFCLKYGKDETVMAQGTFLTTLLALMSIPLVAWLIM
ncbi:MAG: AEC family transporter [Bacteroidales bacterium]|nr:AEC family transporter [Candidatus Liminaster caballi]